VTTQKVTKFLVMMRVSSLAMDEKLRDLPGLNK
jgi:hypothetical protein